MVLTRSLSRASQSSSGNISAQLSPTDKPKNIERSSTDHLLADAISFSSVDAEQFMDQENEQIDFPVLLPESDPSFHQRIFIMQNDFKSGEIYSLAHPRTGSPNLYMLDERADPSEMMRLDLDDHRPRSLFCGDSVVADPGPIMMFLPVHPLFLALPHFEANAKDRFLSVREFLRHDQFPALRLLARNEKLLATLKIAADFEDNEGDLLPKFRYNQNKLMGWLKTKHEALKESLKTNNVEGMDGEEVCNNSNKLDQYSFGILADYLPKIVADQLREMLGIVEQATKNAVVSENGEMKMSTTTAEICQNNKINGGSSSRKRPAAHPLGSFNSPKAVIPAAKKRMTKMLAEASKGTQSLRSFFTANNNNQQKEKVEKKEEKEENAS